MKEAIKEKHVYIAQLLCPARHCVIAMAGEFDSPLGAQATLDSLLRKEFDSAVAQHLINPKCGICDSHQLQIEVRRTRFTTMKEAKPTLEALSIANAAAARYMEESRN